MWAKNIHNQWLDMMFNDYILGITVNSDWILGIMVNSDWSHKHNSALWCWGKWSYSLNTKAWELYNVNVLDNRISNRGVVIWQELTFDTELHGINLISLTVGGLAPVMSCCFSACRRESQTPILDLWKGSEREREGQHGARGQQEGRRTEMEILVERKMKTDESSHNITMLIVYSFLRFLMLFLCSSRKHDQFVHNILA